MTIEYRTNGETGVRNMESPLMLAVRSGEMEAACGLLCTTGAAADINARSFDGRVPLMYAAMAGHTSLVAALLEAGAEVNAQATDGSTALIKACLWRHAQIVQILLERGADVTLTSQDGWTALRIALQQGDQEIAQLLANAGAQA